MPLLRLQKIIAQTGAASLRSAEKLISSGRVSVNGEIIKVLGTKFDPQKCKICIDGKEITPLNKKFYFLLNKPPGYLTTKFDPKGRPTIMEFIKQIGLPLNPVGRLDFATEGLLLLTNDGDLIFKLTHPKFEIEKEYLVEVLGNLTDEKIKRMEQGIKIEEGVTSPAKITNVSYFKKGGNFISRFQIVISEGKKRQIRRMCEALGLMVTYLKRIRMGPVKIGDLKTGRWRMLTEQEVNCLKSYVKRKVKDVNFKKRRRKFSAL